MPGGAAPPNGGADSIDTWATVVDTCKHMTFLRRLFRAPAGDLRAAQEGDKAAIERFYDANVDGLYAFVFYRVGRDPALAEDVVQETFANALSRTADYDASRGSHASWLAVLSRNVIRDQLREHRRADQLLETWERIDATLAQTFAAMAERPLPGDVLERAETRDLVHMAIANLPEQYRNALTRKYVDGDSLETLSQALGISVEATKSLLARARRAFRDTFATLSVHFSEVV
jgi:RNA polymerase sigma-70 factor (ECF subfamily)